MWGRCTAYAEGDVVIEIARAVAQPVIFGVDADHGESGNRVTRVRPFELRIEDSELVRQRALEARPDDRDELDACLDWEVRTAASVVGLQLETWLAPAGYVFYSD